MSWLILALHSIISIAQLLLLFEVCGSILPIWKCLLVGVDQFFVTEMDLLMIILLWISFVFNAIWFKEVSTWMIHYKKYKNTLDQFFLGSTEWYWRWQRLGRIWCLSLSKVLWWICDLSRNLPWRNIKMYPWKTKKWSWEKNMLWKTLCVVQSCKYKGSR